MTRTRSRRVLRAAATVIVLATLVGCGAGFDAQTNLVDGPEGADAEAGDVLVRNTHLVADETDQSTAALVVALINKSQQADALTEVRIGGGASAESTLPPAGLEVPPDELVSIGSEMGPEVSVRAEPGTFQPGSFVQLSLVFRDAGAVDMSVNVQEQAGAYATVTVSPFSTPTPTTTTPAPVPTVETTPTESPTPTPTST